MTRYGYVVWPEGLPEQARFCASRWASAFTRFWLGLKTLRRMCYAHPAHPANSPIVTARECERYIRKARG